MENDRKLPATASVPAVMNVDTIPDFLTEQREEAPDDFQHYFLTFEDYWERKLWHELTDLLLKYFRQDQSAGQRIERGLSPIHREC